MTTQRLSDVVNLLGKSSQNGGNKNKDISNNGDFGSFLDSNLKFGNSSDKNGPAPILRPETTVQRPNLSYQNTASNVHKDSNIKDKNTVKPEKLESKDTKNTKEPVKVEDKVAKDVQGNNGTTESKGTEEKVNELTNKIESVIKEALGINDEELAGLMELLGLQMTDLMNLDNLKLLALAANGETDFTAFLTNENLVGDLNKLMQGMEQVKLEDFGLTDKNLNQFLLEQQSNNNLKMMEKSNIPEKAQKEVQTAEKPVDKVVAESLPVEEVVAEPGNKEVAEAETSSTNIKFHVEKEGQASNETGNKSNNGAGKEANSGVNQNTSLEQLLGNITGASGKSSDNFIEQLAAARQTRVIVNQIVEEIKVTVKPSASSMELQLNPASLGKVHLSVAAKDGILTAQFLVQNAAAKEAIESQIQNLKDTLSNQGLKVEAVEVEVNVSNFLFNESNQAEGDTKEQKQSHRSINLEEANALEGLTEDEEVVADMMRVDGNTVNYTA